MNKIEGIEVIGFDADDTLWENEAYFRETERKLRLLLAPYIEPEQVTDALYQTECRNMSLYGYGVKAYILSVIETAIRVSEAKVPATVLNEILLLGKAQLSQSVRLLDGVEETLKALTGRYRLVVATKGDLLDQGGKLRRSGLEPYFHHVEIMCDKTEREYKQLLNHLDIAPEKFLMIGNSLRSDVLPPLQLGSYAIHVPSATTWAHEQVDEPVVHPRFFTVGQLRDVIHLLA